MNQIHGPRQKPNHLASQLTICQMNHGKFRKGHDQGPERDRVQQGPRSMQKATGNQGQLNRQTKEPEQRTVGLTSCGMSAAMRTKLVSACVRMFVPLSR